MARALECPACGRATVSTRCPTGPRSGAASAVRCSRSRARQLGTGCSAAARPHGRATAAGCDAAGAQRVDATRSCRSSRGGSRRGHGDGGRGHRCCATGHHDCGTTAPPERSGREHARNTGRCRRCGAGERQRQRQRKSQQSSGRAQPVAAAPVAGRPKRTRAHWYWRVLAWIVAVPVAFVVTAWPAYELGFVTKDDLLDVFVGTGTGRYLRIAIVTLVWALVTAVLVQIFVEGGRAWANQAHSGRGRSRHDARATAARPAATSPASTSSPSRRTRAFHHFSVGGELIVEDEEVLDETVEDGSLPLVRRHRRAHRASFRRRLNLPASWCGAGMSVTPRCQARPHVDHRLLRVRDAGHRARVTTASCPSS